MEDMKKRKLGEAAGNVEASSEEELRLLLDPLPKPQLVHLLSKLGSQYPSIAEEIRSIASADPVHRKLFVRGLAWNTTSETLCAAFLMHGEIEEGAVIHDKATGKSRGYGFITYKHMESAQTALSAASKMIDGRLAVCNLACEGLSGASATHDLAQRKLYIGGLSPEITSEKLLSFFGKHGEIEEGSVAYDKDTNESRGFGFVTFKTVDAAKKAIDDPNKMLGLTTEEVEVVTKLTMVGERLYAWKNMVLAEREIVFQGRNIIVKLADTHKGKSLQTQLPTAAGPMTLPMAAGYPQPGSAHVSTAPIGYTYPQPVAPYPHASFSSPPTAAAPYPIQPPISYAPVTLKKEHLGLPAAPAGIGAYPYYISK